MVSARTWKLERYAKQVKEWTHIIGTPEDPITISILNEHKMLIAQGSSKILESLMLWESATWIKGVRKGSAVLLMIKSPLSDAIRKVRFKFVADSGLSAEDQAIECATCLSAYFKFEKEYTKDSFSQFRAEPLQPANKKLLLSDVSKMMVNGDICEILGELYSKTVFPKEQIRHMLTLCLSDPHFPGFVIEVEKLLKQMNSQTSNTQNNSQ